MENVLDWISKNKEWLFSGVGVALAFTIGRLIYKRFFAKGAVHLPTCRKLQGSSEINGVFELIAAGGLKRIQLLIQVLGPKPHLPESIAETIARRIQETTRLGIPIKYDPILVFDTEKPPAGFIEGILRRDDVFSKHGVRQFVRPRYLAQKHNGGVDILIVDRTHLLLLLNTVPDAQAMQVGFLFKDQPEIASEYSDWFDQVLMPSSKYLDEWLQINAAPRPTSNS